MGDTIRLTKQIHYFVRGQLPFEEELKLLEEIIESDKWLGHLGIEMMLYHTGCRQQMLAKQNNFYRRNKEISC